VELILDAATLASMANLQERALRALARVESPVWRRHLEDLAVACDTVIACALRLHDHGSTGSQYDPDFGAGMRDWRSLERYKRRSLSPAALFSGYFASSPSVRMLGVVIP
jgi:hypothetical protein